MKCYLLFLIFFTTSALANCFEFELIGEALIKEDHISYIVAKNTQSEVQLAVPLSEQDHFAAYINRWSKSRLILNSELLNFNTKLLKVISVEYETPDPLNMMSSTHIKKLKEVACPKG